MLCVNTRGSLHLLFFVTPARRSIDPLHLFRRNEAFNLLCEAPAVYKNLLTPHISAAMTWGGMKSRTWGRVCPPHPC